MAAPYRSKERTSAAIRDGFDSAPTPMKVEEGQVLIVYRAHNGFRPGSRLISPCFFTPRTGDVPSVNWTAEMLERELNAALWGNEFRYLAKFQVAQGVQYRMGPIAHDRYQGVERPTGLAGNVDVPFDQYSFFANDHRFFQVEIPMERHWTEYLKLLADNPLKPGRFHGKAGHA